MVEIDIGVGAFCSDGGQAGKRARPALVDGCDGMGPVVIVRFGGMIVVIVLLSRRVMIVFGFGRYG